MITISLLLTLLACGFAVLFPLYQSFLTIRVVFEGGSYSFERRQWCNHIVLYILRDNLEHFSLID